MLNKFISWGLTMRQTDLTLLEQMRITDFEVEHRKSLFSLTESDCVLLRNVKSAIDTKIDFVVADFYELQTNVPEVSLLIGDADTLRRLKSAMRKYVLDLFSGLYDLEYVNNRLRIGLVHKRIGVEPKLYLSAVNVLKELLNKFIHIEVTDEEKRIATEIALGKLLSFDIALVFETYIRSLVSEIETSRNKSEQYARLLEEKVKERTQQLEEMTRTDPLTGLLNVRYLQEALTRTLRAAQRRSEPVTVVYMDVNDFKIVNDTQGHQQGDEILRVVANAIKAVSRLEDSCFRYGGDEFCLVLPNSTKEEAQEAYLNRLTHELERHMKGMSLSIGIAQTGTELYVDADTLIRLADEDMYRAKTEHKLKTTKEIQKTQ